MKFIVLFLSTFIYAQNMYKVRIINSEEGNPITNARVLFHNEITYSNDDGFVIIPKNVTEIEVSKFGYNPIKINKIPSIILLSPTYNDIEEVNIININIKNFFIDIYKNYRKAYSTKPSVYDIVYKQKDYLNNYLTFLLISEAQLWTEDNSYNFKSAQEKNYDDFVQLELNSLKHIKSTLFQDNICQGYSINYSKDFVGNFFFNYELKRILNFFSIEGVKYSGKIIKENYDEQIISFKISTSIIDIKGMITYNKIDKAISYYEMTYDQSKSPAEKRLTSTNENFEYKVGNGIIIYEFHKVNKKYLPSLIKTKGYSYCLYKDSNNKIDFDREIVFRKQQKEKKTSLINKVDLNKKIWENIPPINEINILLSDEEEKFINDTTYEN